MMTRSAAPTGPAGSSTPRSQPDNAAESTTITLSMPDADRMPDRDNGRTLDVFDAMSECPPRLIRGRLSYKDSPLAYRHAWRRPMRLG